MSVNIGRIVDADCIGLIPLSERGRLLRRWHMATGYMSRREVITDIFCSLARLQEPEQHRALQRAKSAAVDRLKAVYQVKISHTKDCVSPVEGLPEIDLHDVIDRGLSSLIPEKDRDDLFREWRSATKYTSRRDVLTDVFCSIAKVEESDQHPMLYREKCETVYRLKAIYQSPRPRAGESVSSVRELSELDASEVSSWGDQYGSSAGISPEQEVVNSPNSGDVA